MTKTVMLLNVSNAVPLVINETFAAVDAKIKRTDNGNPFTVFTLNGARPVKVRKSLIAQYAPISDAEAEQLRRSTGAIL